MAILLIVYCNPSKLALDVHVVCSVSHCWVLYSSKIRHGLSFAPVLRQFLLSFAFILYFLWKIINIINYNHNTLNKREWQRYHAVISIICNQCLQKSIHTWYWIFKVSKCFNASLNYLLHKLEWILSTVVCSLHDLGERDQPYVSHTWNVGSIWSQNVNGQIWYDTRN